MIVCCLLQGCVRPRGHHHPADVQGLAVSYEVGLHTDVLTFFLIPLTSFELCSRWRKGSGGLFKSVCLFMSTFFIVFTPTWEATIERNVRMFYFWGGVKSKQLFIFY